MKFALSAAILSAFLPSTSALISVVVSGTTTDPCAGFDVSTCPTMDPGSPFEPGCVLGSCGPVPKPPGELCDCTGQRGCDDCTYGTTDGFGNCVPTYPSIKSNLEIELFDLFQVKYRDLVNNEPNIILRFKYSTWSDLAVDPLAVQFAAIFFAGRTCGRGDRIIGATVPQPGDSWASTPIWASDASIPTKYAFTGTTNEPTQRPGKHYGVWLNIWTPFTEFDTPFYRQDRFCRASELLSTERCGKLSFCVEFQVLLCGKKIDFVDVYVYIELDIEVQCEEDCADVTLERAAQVDVDGSAQADFPIKCEACEENDCLLERNVFQGEPIKACLKIKNVLKPAGACIIEVEELFFELKKNQRGIDVKTTWTIIPYGNGDLNLFSGFDGLDYSPGECWPGVDGATAGFQPPAWMFQEVLPGQTLKYRFQGSVILGFGCYCDEPPTCTKPARIARNLQGDADRELQGDEGSLTLVGFTGDELDIGVDVAEEPAAPTADGCGLAALLS